MKPIEEALALSEMQLEQLRAYEELLRSLTVRHNLISAASTDDIWVRHIRHALTLGIRSFPTGTTVVDWGTGGGLPGIPLAITFPKTRFVLVDSTGKKIRAVDLMIRRLGLENVAAWHGRAEEWEGRAHIAVSRATAPLADLWEWTERVLESRLRDSERVWGSSVLALKGGDLSDEIEALERRFAVDVALHPLDDLVPEAAGARRVIVEVRPAAARD